MIIRFAFPLPTEFRENNSIVPAAIHRIVVLCGKVNRSNNNHIIRQVNNCNRN